jgi:hypothetical protein
MARVVAQVSIDAAEAPADAVASNALHDAAVPAADLLYKVARIFGILSVGYSIRYKLNLTEFLAVDLQRDIEIFG